VRALKNKGTERITRKQIEVAKLARDFRRRVKMGEAQLQIETFLPGQGVTKKRSLTVDMSMQRHGRTVGAAWSKAEEIRRRIIKSLDTHAGALISPALAFKALLECAHHDSSAD